MRAFDVAANSLISTSQETCDVNRSSVLEDLEVDDEVSESIDNF